MKDILIKFKRKKGNESTLDAAVGTNGSLNGDGHNLKNGEPAIFETSDGKQYVAVGSPDPNTGETSTSDAKYVKLQPKGKVDNVLYKGTDNSNIITLQDDTGTDKKLSVTCGGTGKDSLTNNGILVGKGTSSVGAVTGQNKALYFNENKVPVAGTLPVNAGGTGSTTLDAFVNSLSGYLGFSEIKTGSYTPTKDVLNSMFVYAGSYYTKYYLRLDSNTYFNGKELQAIIIVPHVDTGNHDTENVPFVAIPLGGSSNPLSHSYAPGAYYRSSIPALLPGGIRWYYNCVSDVNGNIVYSVTERSTGNTVATRGLFLPAYNPRNSNSASFANLNETYYYIAILK